MNVEDIQIDSHLTLTQNIKVWTHFNTDVITVFARPEQLTKLYKNTPVVWTDKSQGSIGFADADQCVMVKLSHIVSFAIQNIKPAKGAGGSYLILKLKNVPHPDQILYGPYGALNSYKNRLGEMVEREVAVKQEYHDC